MNYHNISDDSAGKSQISTLKDPMPQHSVQLSTSHEEEEKEENVIALDTLSNTPANANPSLTNDTHDDVKINDGSISSSVAPNLLPQQQGDSRGLETNRHRNARRHNVQSAVSQQPRQEIKLRKHGDEASFFEDMFLTPFLEAHFSSNQERKGSGPFLRRSLSYIRDETKNPTKEKVLKGKNKKKKQSLPKKRTKTAVKNENSKASKMNRQRIICHFLYHYPQSKNPSSSSIQDFTFDLDDSICPLCSFRYKTSETLLIHCRSHHGNTLRFDDTTDSQGNVRGSFFMS
jgi:hypothetical protein